MLHCFAAAVKKSQVFFVQSLDGKPQIDMVFEGHNVKLAISKGGNAPFHLLFGLRNGLENKAS